MKGRIVWKTLLFLTLVILAVTLVVVQQIIVLSDRSFAAFCFIFFRVNGPSSALCFAAHCFLFPLAKVFSIV